MLPVGNICILTTGEQHFEKSILLIPVLNIFLLHVIEIVFHDLSKMSEITPTMIYQEQHPPPQLPNLKRN